MRSPWTRFLSSFFPPPSNQGDAHPASVKKSRAPRFRPPIEVRFLTGSQAFEVTNLSLSGLGLRISSDSNDVPLPGSRLPGELTYGDQRIALELKVVHRSGDVLGCSFAPDHPTAQAELYRRFRAEIAAHGLVQMPAEHVQSEADGQAHWFQGEDQNELHFVIRDSRVVRFRITYRGIHLEGSVDAPLRIGQVVKDRLSEKPAYKPSSLIHKKLEISPGDLEEIERFLQAIPQAFPSLPAFVIREIHSMMRRGANFP